MEVDFDQRDRVVGSQGGGSRGAGHPMENEAHEEAPEEQEGHQSRTVTRRMPSTGRPIATNQLQVN
jgi:hypothetical protein